MTPDVLQRARNQAWCRYCGSEIGSRSITCVAHTHVRLLDEHVPAEPWPRAEWAWDADDYAPAPELAAALLERVA